MKNKLTVVFALTAGFVGGAMSHYIFAPATVHAQVQSPPAEIRAQKFVLVDERGKPRAVFGFNRHGEPEIQADFGKPKGARKLISAEVGYVDWHGVGLKSNVLPDLR
jgi:hypothetical protein